MLLAYQRPAIKRIPAALPGKYHALCLTSTNIPTRPLRPTRSSVRVTLRDNAVDYSLCEHLQVMHALCHTRSCWCIRRVRRYLVRPPLGSNLGASQPEVEIFGLDIWPPIEPVQKLRTRGSYRSWLARIVFHYSKYMETCLSL
jgi:hypothetical protein